MSKATSQPVFVVSGLPRSGTSLMMQMLRAGGIDVLTDGERSADDDNPHGYYELEAVKRTRIDPAWLVDAGGKAVKVISQLLFDLPASRTYKVIFMRRSLEEVLLSQQKMLARRGVRHGASDDAFKELFIDHLAKMESFFKSAPHVRVLFVNYARLVAEPDTSAERISKFLNLELDVAAMAASVRPELYRNRASAPQ
jgi:hypothetical protein